MPVWLRVKWHWGVTFEYQVVAFSTIHVLTFHSLWRLPAMGWSFRESRRPNHSFMGILTCDICAPLVDANIRKLVLAWRSQTLMLNTMRMVGKW